MSKTIDKWMEKHPNVIESYHREWDGCFDGEPEYGGRDVQAYWIYLTEDWISPATECGVIHEANVKKVLQELGWIEKKSEYYARWS